MNLKVELIKKVSDLRGILRSSQQITDDRISRIKDDRIYLLVKDITEFNDFSKFGTVELAPVQTGNLLFSEKECLNPLENTLQDDVGYQTFLKDPAGITQIVETPLDTLNTPLLEALRDKKSQKSHSKKSLSKKELYQPVMANSRLPESILDSKKSSKKQKKVTAVQKASLGKTLGSLF